MSRKTGQVASNDSNDSSVFHIDIDEHRHGSAGMHDLIDVQNINRTLKKNEILSEFKSIYLKPPSTFQRGRQKMLLVQGPHDERAGTAMFPLGLGYIARVLVDIGVEVEVLDAHAEKLSPEETLERVKNNNCHIIGITALSTQYGFVKWLVNEVKQDRPNVTIIVGGQLAHYNSHTLIENSMTDICVIGEGEITVQDIIYNMEDLAKVSGIAFRDGDGQYRRNPDRPRIFNPDVIPFPYWDAFNMDYYFTAGVFSRARRAVNILSSRGCPYSCTFCSLSFPNVTYRSVDNVVEEIQLLKDRYDVNGVMFCDELFVIDKKQVYEFCEKLKPLNISWGGQGRANIVNDDEKLLRAMKEAGAAYIGYGLESSTNEMLKKMEKKATLQHNINCVKTAQKVGLVVVAQYLFGFPGENLESVKAGIEYFKEVNYCPPLGSQAACHISLVTPLPGSELYEECKRNGMILNEDEYLRNISIGYFHNKEVVVNLTSFSDDELLDLKYATQEIMAQNHLEWLRSQGWLFTAKSAIRSIREIYQYEGLFLLVVRLARRTKRTIAQLLRGGVGKLRIWNALYPGSEVKTDYIYRSSRSAEFKKAIKS